MSEAVHPVPEDFNARIGKTELDALYSVAAADTHRNGMDPSRRLDWYRFPEQSGDWSFDEVNQFITNPKGFVPGTFAIWFQSTAVSPFVGSSCPVITVKLEQ